MSILLGKLEVLLLTFWVIQLSTAFYNPFIGSFKVLDLNLSTRTIFLFIVWIFCSKGTCDSLLKVSLFYCVPGYFFLNFRASVSVYMNIQEPYITRLEKQS